MQTYETVTTEARTHAGITVPMLLVLGGLGSTPIVDVLPLVVFVCVCVSDHAGARRAPLPRLLRRWCVCVWPFCAL